MSVRYAVVVAVVMSLPLFAQFVPRTPLFEHFTQASCGPCAQQNPVFQDNILRQYRPLINHVAYHTSWPGVDPMNDHNPGEVQTRVSYYRVSGVPHMIMDGNVWEGGPAGVTETLVESEIARGAPVALSVQLDKTASPWHVEVIITSVTELPAGDYRLFVAAVEESITYDTPPGSNGERYFPNVFRKFLTSDRGDPLSLPPVGQSDTVVLSLQPDVEWEADSIYALAFIEEYGTKTVLNSASSLFPSILIISQTPGLVELAPGETQDFRFNVQLEQPIRVTIGIDANMPAAWSYAVTVDGMTVNDGDTLVLSGRSYYEGTLTVTTSGAAGYGIVKLLVDPIEPDWAPVMLVYQVIVSSDVVLLHSSQAFGDGKDHYQKLRSTVEQLMDQAGISYLALPVQQYVLARQAQLLNTVATIFYAAGWTFPALPPALVEQLQQLLDHGGNLFIAGQDIGWDVWDPNGFGTTAARQFYQNYLHTRYIDDGTAARMRILPNNQDFVFRSVGQATIHEFYPGHLYPDALQPRDSLASVAWVYNDGAVAGIRAETDRYKVVYLGIGIEQIAEPNVASEILRWSKRWFDGAISGVELDHRLHKLQQGSWYQLEWEYPISGTLLVGDELGRIVRSMMLENTRSIFLPLTAVAPGIYWYRIVGTTGTVLDMGIVVVP